MTIADNVKQTIMEKCAVTFSISCGYGIANGKTVHFPVGAQELEKRNKNGRVIHSRYRYADNSTLAYRYNSSAETYTLETTKNE